MARTNKYTSFNLNDIFDKSTSTTSSSSSSATSRSPSSPALPHKSYSLSASSRHGGMLVLSRPKPQPQPQPHPPPQQQQQQQPQPLSQRQQPALPNSLDFPAITSPVSSKPLASDSLISLRPQGKTGGAAPSFQERDSGNKVDVSSPKGNKFVPPHLRPGYVPREVPSVPEFQKPMPGNFTRPGNYSDNTHRPNSGGGYHYHHGSGNGYVDNGRPMSGGGGGGYNRPRSAHENYHGSVENGRPMSGGGGGYNRPGSAHENYHGSGGGYNRPGSAHGNYYGSSNVYVDDGRPSSGGGYDRRMRGGAGAGAHVAGGESESYMMNRPRSSGSRPNSRG